MIKPLIRHEMKSYREMMAAVRDRNEAARLRVLDAWILSRPSAAKGNK